MLIHEHKTYDNPLGLPIAIRKTRNCEFASHWHTDFEAAFVLEGGVRVSLNGIQAQLHEGDAFVCSGGDIHSYAEPSDDLQVLLLTFDPLAARKTGTLVMDSPVRSSVFYRDVKRTGTQLKALLNRMYEEYTHMSAGSEFFLYAYILEIQGILHRYYAKTAFQPGGTGRQTHLHLIRESISYIEAHFAEEITLKSMAKAALMSESNFSREFKKITGTGFKEYVTLVRLREVAAALGEGGAGVAAVAYACGFGSVRTFNRVFRTRYSVTPGMYCAGLRAGLTRY
ncbi:MAG: helix-turn-helix transcriptional regulator [Clostridiales bacterium]|nr:helix-turn-helix transcriptional regulator [Clostridiales bacterium]